MILAALMLVLAQGDVTLAAVERLPPLAGGELVLAGKDHGPVETVVRRPARGMDPPGLIQLDLVEAAVAAPDGCTRKRWTASFSQPPGAPAGEAVLSDAYAATEISMTLSGPCADESYVHLNPGVTRAEAFAVLAKLKGVASGRIKPDFSCVDATASVLCHDIGTFRRELARLRPWAVTREEGAFVVWLGVPGQVVTEVRFEPGPGNRVAVSRRYPAPF
jgi:hypothetical protein